MLAELDKLTVIRRPLSGPGTGSRYQLLSVLLRSTRTYYVNVVRKQCSHR